MIVLDLLEEVIKKIITLELIKNFMVAYHYGKKYSLTLYIMKKKVKMKQEIFILQRRIKMAKLISTKEKIDKLIHEFHHIEKTFVIKEYFNVSETNEWKLHFYLNNNDCSINLLFKKTNVITILYVTKNKE